MDPVVVKPILVGQQEELIGNGELDVAPRVGEELGQLRGQAEAQKKGFVYQRPAVLPTEADVEKAKIFLQARVSNAERSKVRDEIDNSLGEAVFSGKIKYHKE